jgi:hypothetical protein
MIQQLNFGHCICLLTAIYLTGCVKESTTEIAGNTDTPPTVSLPPVTYSSITGAWSVSTRTDFGNDNFTAYLSINTLNLTQTNQLFPGFTHDVYRVTGNFSGFTLALQRKSDGTLYPVYWDASGSISNGGINTAMASHNLEFYLGSSTNYRLRGVAPAYQSMWGDVTVTINMTDVFRTSDGIVTVTGMWDGARQ